MGRKFKVWLDSGANIHSCYKQEIDIEEDLGISDDEWDSYSEATVLNGKFMELPDDTLHSSPRSF
ncbi:hypothetical protein C3M82_000002 [Salmonella enterica subsp. enterica serovar Minnesota]|nr:hypothetical protein [Salmonella enterica subsp. enterica serovar Minnesota]